MCYNCGCEMPNDDMGKGKISLGGGSLTQEDIKHMAKAWDMHEQETMQHMHDLLEKELEKRKQKSP